LSQNDEFIGELFDDKAPYTIMFGPDKCGRTNKVHFIFRHKNPKTGEIEEKHLKNAPEIKSDSLTNLYTLIIHGSDNTYEIKINSEQVRKGSLFEDFEPPVNPPEMIDDPEDKKPEDWVDVAKIPDPTATKPDDWDEDAPYQIEDLSAEKPYDWLDNEPELIPDPEAFKPDDWDDEDDGAWEAPIVENPKCKEVSGCGEWQRPMKKNPAYKGKWKAPMIDNPAYKGEWKPRLIPNPNYFKDDHPARFTPIGAIGFELWTLQANILFDNILITDDVTLAEEYASKYWAPKQESEIAERDKDKPSALGGFLESAQEQVLEFFTEFQTDPLNTLKEQPVAALVVFLLPVLIFLIILAACIPSSAPEPLPRRPVPRETPKAEGGEEKQDSKDSQESKTSKDAKDSKDEKNK
jgi:calnexin